ncbi:MAG: sigma-54 dependent transcriptional regulator [Phycisphaerae bacterium]|jgi:DNA-binding NtrC family response regulator
MIDKHKNNVADQAEKVRILLVDDDQIILDSLGGFLSLEGYEVQTASAIPQAIDCLRAGRYHLVITDVNMPSSDGFELLRYVRSHQADVMVIMVTGYGTIESAVEAIKQGAYDYLTKPIIDDDVRLAVRRALQQQHLVAENRQLKQALSGRYRLGNIIGQHYRMSKVFDLIDAVAESKTNVLITGESGTGKSLIAHAIHTGSPRRDKPFVEVSCGALPDTLLESELFGHVRGAFTHAVVDKQGKFAAADGGTIFLDEISTASPQLQVKLLRVLQERNFEPVGSNQTLRVDVRVILATNHDLRQEVEAGRFRNDLYYRINVVNIELPPLRERLGDIPLLADFFLAKYLDGSPRKIEGFAPEAMELMRRYCWPGNVRELENCVERAVVLCRSPLIGPDDLPPALLHSNVSSGSSPRPLGRMTLDQALEEPEKQILRSALEANEGSRQATARQLGINRTTLYKKMKRYGLMD